MAVAARDLEVVMITSSGARDRVRTARPEFEPVRTYGLHRGAG